MSLVFMVGVSRAQSEGVTLVIVGKAAHKDSGAPARAVTVHLTVPGAASEVRRASAETSQQGLYDLIYEAKGQVSGSVYLACAPPVRCRARRIDFPDPQASIRTETLKVPLLVRSAVLPGGALSEPVAAWHLSAILETAVLDRLAGGATPEAMAQRVRGQAARVVRRLSGYRTGAEIARLLMTSWAQVSAGDLATLPDLAALLADLGADARGQDLAGQLAQDLAGQLDVEVRDNTDRNDEIRQGSQSGDHGEEQASEVIVVTGTTISPSTPPALLPFTGTAIRRPVPPALLPVTVFDRQALKSSGVATVGEFMQDLPMQYNGSNRQFNEGGDGATRFDLRGLGPERTLVLVNGRRYLPGGLGANKSVDLDDVPMALLDRIEVFSSGASAVYGSDAMSGVVNLVLREDVRGAEAIGYLGSTRDGSGTVYNLSAATGYSGQRGRVTAALSFFDQQPIMAIDRAFSQFATSYDWQASQADPDNNPNRDDVFHPNGSTASPHGYLNDRMGLDGNQAWQDVINGSCTSGICRVDTMSDFQYSGEDDLGDLYNYQPENYLLVPLRRVNAVAAGTYRLGHNVSAFADFLFTYHQSVRQTPSPALLTISENLAVDADNFHNPFEREFTDIRRRVLEVGPERTLTRRLSLRAIVGLSGDMPGQVSWLKGWRWTVHGNLGESQIDESRPGRLVRDRVRQALGPSHEDGSGTPRCGTLEDPGAPECVPLNLFGGAGSITEDMLGYLSAELTNTGSNRHWLLGFQTEGKLFDTPWNGDVRLALGAETRTVSGSVLPDPRLTAGDIIASNRLSPVEGSYTLRAARAELSAVPVTRRPGARWLEFDAGLRLAQADRYTDVSTWKLTALWQPLQGLTLRAARSRDTRAPSLLEIFAAPEQSLPGVTDPCDTSLNDRTPIATQNCTAAGLAPDFADDRIQFPTQIGGASSKLTAELANSLDLRLVVEPPWLPGLLLSLTYFDIEIYNKIDRHGAGALLSACYLVEAPDPASCAAIERDPDTGLIEVIDDTPHNSRNRLTTTGIDAAMEYRHTTRFGHFRHQLLGTWLRSFVYSQLSREIQGAGVYDLGVFPRWKFNASSMWSGRYLGGSLTVRYIGSFTECEGDDCHLGEEFDPEINPEPLSRPIDASVTADVQGRFTFNNALGTAIIELGINNIANSSYVIVVNGFYATSDASTYDFAGRLGYLRLTQKF